jgi:hypothetical protein
MSLAPNALGHDIETRMFCYNNAAGIAINSFRSQKVFVVPTAGQTIYIMVSSNLAAVNNPTYYVSYEVTRLA